MDTPSSVPNQRLPFLSSKILQTILFLKPASTVKCVKDFPSYLDAPPSVPNQRFPFLSCNMQRIISCFKPCSLLKEEKDCGLLSFMCGSFARVTSGAPATKVLLIAGTFLGSIKLPCPSVIIFGVPATTILGSLAMCMLVLVGTTFGLPTGIFLSLFSSTKITLGIDMLSFGTM